MQASKIDRLSKEDYCEFSLAYAMFICKNDEHFTFNAINTICLKFLGYTRRELNKLFNNRSMNLIHPEDRNIARESVDRAVAKSHGEQCFNVKLRINSKQRGYYLVDFNGRVFEREGKQLIAVAVSSGIRQILFTEQMKGFEEFIDQVKNLTEDNFFEYNIEKDIMACSGMFTARFDLPEIIHNFSQLIRSGKIVDAESRGIVSSEQLKNNGDKTVSAKIKLNDNKGNHYWYMAHFRVYNDTNGVPIKVIGKMNDITEQQKEIDLLTKISETDMLTGLYNRSSAEYLIKESLRKRRGGDGSGHTLMIVDIDNFKTLNDSIGHMYGDAVLTQLSDLLKEIFRSDDVIGRLGGDEFFVLIKNCSNDEIIEEKAKEVCKAFRKTFTEVGNPVEISASIGIAKSPLHGNDFDTLYRCADLALYTVKAAGKNGYKFYHDDMSAPMYTSKRTEMDSEKSGAINLNNNLIEFIFKMLRQSNNVNNIMPAILKLIAEQHGLSKGYIFEMQEDAQSISKTFSFDNEAKFGPNELLNDFTLEDFKTSYESLTKNNRFVLNSLNELTDEAERESLAAAGVKSMIAFPIISKGEFLGFVAFEDSAKEHTFDEATVSELETICGIITTFLLNLRLEEMLNNK